MWRDVAFWASTFGGLGLFVIAAMPYVISGARHVFGGRSHDDVPRTMKTGLSTTKVVMASANLMVFGLALVLLALIFLRPDSPGAAVSTSGCERAFRITYPKNGTRISGKAGVEVRGKACGTDSVWLFDFDPGDHSLFLDDEGPIRATAGRWRFLDMPIGDPHDPIGTSYGILAIRSASQRCDKALASLVPDSNGDLTLDTLPLGCPNVKGPAGVRRVSVIRAKP